MYFLWSLLVFSNWVGVVFFDCLFISFLCGVCFHLLSLFSQDRRTERRRGVSHRGRRTQHVPRRAPPRDPPRARRLCRATPGRNERQNGRLLQHGLLCYLLRRNDNRCDSRPKPQRNWPVDFRTGRWRISLHRFGRFVARIEAGRSAKRRVTAVALDAAEFRPPHRSGNHGVDCVFWVGHQIHHTLLIPVSCWNDLFHSNGFLFCANPPGRFDFFELLNPQCSFRGILFYDDLMEKCAAFIVSRLLVQFVFGIIPTNARTFFVFSLSSLWISSLFQTKTKPENFNAKNVLEHVHLLFQCSIFVTIKNFQHICRMKKTRE